MTSIRVRPRFKLTIDIPMAEIQQEFYDQMKAENSPCTGHIVPGFITLKIPTNDRHFWSPQLTLTLEKENESTLVRGLYGPNPTVWAIFTMGFGAVAILGLFALILGLVQVTMADNPWGLWVLPGLAIVAFLLYFGSQAGQKLGVEQTFQIHGFVEKVLKEKIHIT